MKKIFLLLLVFVSFESVFSQEISVSKSTLDYGNISKGSNPVRKFKITNKGDKPLEIKSCKGSCYCITPTCPSGKIMPGQSKEVSIKYDTNRMGQINKTITIMSNDPKKNAVVIKVKGNIQ